MGHFDYVLQDSKETHTKVAADRLELLANTAAKRYLQERVPLTNSIRKIASENDLNRNQVERVCEMANIATHRALWSKTAQKESIAFPLAKAAEVVDVVSKVPLDSGDPGSPMISPSSVDSDYAGPPKGIPCGGPSTMSMMGADPEAVHNGMTDDGEKKRIVIVIEKKAAQRADLASRVVYQGMELESLEKKAFNAVKQTILGGASFNQIYQAAVGVGMGKIAEQYLPEWQEKIISQAHGSQRLRLEKIAICKAPEDLISDNMGNTTVINGAHPVLISLDTIQRKTGEIKQGLHNLLRIDDEVKVFNQRIRELS